MHPELQDLVDIVGKNITPHNHNSDSIRRYFDLVLEEVESDNGSDVVLGTVFVNLLHDTHGHRTHPHIQLFVFSEHGKATYHFKRNDFWINQGRDPIIVKGIGNYQVGLKFGDPSGFDALLFFSENPFTSKKYQKAFEEGYVLSIW